MKIVKELPKRTRRMSSPTERRIKEIKEFASTGERYGLVDFMTSKYISNEAYFYKKAIATYKERGGEGEFEVRTINKKVYIIRTA